jgi:hypothetical protein
MKFGAFMKIQGGVLKTAGVVKKFLASKLNILAYCIAYK